MFDFLKNLFKEPCQHLASKETGKGSHYMNSPLMCINGKQTIEMKQYAESVSYECLRCGAHFKRFK